MVVTYTDLAYFDDLLVDCLIDRLFYWAKIRKVKEYKPVRGIPQATLVRLVQDVIKHDSSIGTSAEEFVRLPSVKAFLGRFRDKSTRQEFERHVKRYLSLYTANCGFGIEVTDRYLSRSKCVEACVISRKVFEPEEQIKYLVGFLSKLNQDEEQELNKGKDFSIINSTRRGANCLMLGPARFVNHDCAANAKFVSNSRSMAVYAKRRINVGEEITVEYAENYFGKRNRECLCATCEKLGINGFGNEPPEDSSSSESDSEDESENQVEREHPVKNENGEETKLALPGSVRGDQDDFGNSSSPSQLSSRSSSVETPTTSIEPEQHTPSIDSERSSIEPESGRPRERSLRPRKSMDKPPVMPVLKLSREAMFRKVLELQRNYDCGIFKSDNTLDCENCQVPFLPVEEADLSLLHLVRRYCPRCFRHAKLYNAFWPGVAPEEEVIELYRDPNAVSEEESSDEESEEEEEVVIKRPYRRRVASKPKPLPAVSEEYFQKKEAPRRLSAWMLKRLEEDGGRSGLRRSASMPLSQSSRSAVSKENTNRTSRRRSVRLYGN